MVSGWDENLAVETSAEPGWQKWHLDGSEIEALVLPAANPDSHQFLGEEGGRDVHGSLSVAHVQCVLCDGIYVN